MKSTRIFSMQRCMSRTIWPRSNPWLGSSEKNCIAEIRNSLSAGESHFSSHSLNQYSPRPFERTILPRGYRETELPSLGPVLIEKAVDITYHRNLTTKYRIDACNSINAGGKIMVITRDARIAIPAFLRCLAPIKRFAPAITFPPRTRRIDETKPASETTFYRPRAIAVPSEPCSPSRPRVGKCTLTTDLE